MSDNSVFITPKSSVGVKIYWLFQYFIFVNRVKEKSVYFKHRYFWGNYLNRARSIYFHVSYCIQR